VVRFASSRSETGGSLFCPCLNEIAPIRRGVLLFQTESSAKGQNII
uniref:Uncharacterized protein n=1 Tax=Anopheles albimanus TaxID=7167 RepID=A0A182FZ00_ANOAL